MSTNCNLCFPSIVNAISDLLRSVEMIKHLISEGNKVEDLSTAWTACTLQKREASTAPSRQVRRVPYSLPYLYSSATIFNGKVPSFHYWERASTKWASGVSLGRPSHPRTVAYSARRAMPSSTHPVENVYNETSTLSIHKSFQRPKWPPQLPHSLKNMLYNTIPALCKAALRTCPEDAVFSAIFLSQLAIACTVAPTLR